MTDPFTAGAIGAVVLAEGVKFVYAQAGELIKHWRERRRADGQAASPGPVLQVPPDLTAGTPESVPPEPARLEELGDKLGEARRDLTEYVEGIREIRPDDLELWKQFDHLRRMLEVVYGQRITLQGEPRPASGPIVVGQVDVDELAGEAIGVDADLVEGGELQGTVTAEKVEKGGRAVGVQAKHVRQ